MSTNFAVAVDGFSTTVAAQRNPAGATLTVASASGLPALSGSQFLRLTIANSSTFAIITVLKVTAVSGTTLTTPSTLDGYADATCPVGALAYISDNGGTLSAIQAAINANETTLAGLGTASTHAATDFQTAGAAIPESQVTGLTSDLATLAAGVAASALDSAVVHKTGTETIAGAKTFSTAPILAGLTGLLKASSGSLSAAAAETDYYAPGQAIQAADVPSIPESRVTNLTTDLATLTAGVAAAAVDTAVLHKLSNLSDLASVATARTNLGLVASATTDTTNAANISSGTLPAGRLPNPSATTLGGVQSAAAVSHQWIASISTAGVPSLSQPAFADISGTASTAQIGTGTPAAGKYVDGGTGAWTTLPAGGGGSPGGSSGQVQYDNAGAFGGASGLLIGASGNPNLPSMAAPGTPTNGDLWHDSAQHALAYVRGGLIDYGQGLIYQQVADPSATAAAANSLVSTSGAVGTVSLPAGYLNVAGREIVIRAAGYGTTGGTPGQAGFFGKLGSNVVAAMGNFSLGASKTTVGWFAELHIVTKATGASGKLDCFGWASGATLWSTSGLIALQNATSATALTPTSQITLDLTAAYAVDFGVNLTVTGNTITCTNLSIEVKG